MADKIDANDIELGKSFYHKGYREGFEGALKIVWALADELKLRVSKENKSLVEDFIEKLTM